MPFIASIGYSLGYNTLTHGGEINRSNLIIWLEASNYTSGSTWPNLITGQTTYTLVNGPTTSNVTYNGKNTTGISFNGTNQYTFPAASLLTAAQSNNWAETKELWYYNRSGNGTFFSEQGTTTLDGSWYDYQGGLLNTSLIYSLWQGVSQTAFTANTGMQPDTWYHIVWQHNKTNNQFLAYVNGTLTMNTTAARVTPDSIGSQYYIFLAARTTTNPVASSTYFNGLIGAFRWYNTVLTAAQIRSNFEAQRATYGV